MERKGKKGHDRPRGQHILKVFFLCFTQLIRTKSVGRFKMSVFKDSKYFLFLEFDVFCLHVHPKNKQKTRKNIKSIELPRTISTNKKISFQLSTTCNCFLKCLLNITINETENRCISVEDSQRPIK